MHGSAANRSSIYCRGSRLTELRVYPHVLASSAEVVEWVKGTTLTRFRARLPADAFAAFVSAYERRLLDRLGDRAPFLYLFKRVLFWGTRR